MHNLTNTSPKMIVLNGKTTIESGISDHNILINSDTLFFNMMMQGRWNNTKKRFNNGFGKIESTEDYQKRITTVVRLLAEAVENNPRISIIGLAEAPIKIQDIALFINESKKYSSLDRFQNTIKSTVFTPMGICTFIDSDRYSIQQIRCVQADSIESLKDRIQSFHLKPTDGSNEFLLHNFHLPYDLAKSKDKGQLITFINQLFQNEEALPVKLIGDFNIHPMTITKALPNTSSYVQRNNNLQLKINSAKQTFSRYLETVDGILQTAKLCRDTRSRYIDARKLKWFGTDLQREFRLAKKVLSKFCIFNNTDKRRALLTFEIQELTSSSNLFQTAMNVSM